jgi:mannitol/fructose-specific phosphotransferase system IIA component (Ntr-type)
MMLAEYLAKNKILFNIEAADYQQVLRKLLGVSNADIDQAMRKITEREAIMSTVLGKGIALPRATLDDLPETEIIIGIIPKGLKLGSFDLIPTRIIILHLFTREDDRASILAQTLRLMNDDNLKNEIIHCRDADNVINTVREWEEEE